MGFVIEDIWQRCHEVIDDISDRVCDVNEIAISNPSITNSHHRKGLSIIRQEN